MEKIYLIEDINSLKYVGRTKQTLKERLRKHKVAKKMNRKNASKKLDLDKCTITCLDIADSPEEANKLEKFYINSIDCVNHYKYNFDLKKYRKKYSKEYHEKNKDKTKEQKKQNYYYQTSWGGDKRYHNNLLEIDPDLFNYRNLNMILS